jgi:putative methyltransferase (TIGR04325 family)
MSLIRRLRRRLFPPVQAIEGYENEELVETIFRKTVAYDPKGDWALVSGVKTVLDFGGGAGLHYKLARLQNPHIRWAVVETQAMVRRASELATDRLKFFTDVGMAADWLTDVELMHSNGAVQYVPDPIEIVRSLCAVHPATIVWRRVPTHDGAADVREVQTSFLSDNGPGSLPTASDKVVRYERRRIAVQPFLAAHEGYHMTERSPDPLEHGTEQFRFARSS